MATKKSTKQASVSGKSEGLPGETPDNGQAKTEVKAENLDAMEAFINRVSPGTATEARGNGFMGMGNATADMTMGAQDETQDNQDVVSSDVDMGNNGAGDSAGTPEGASGDIEGGGTGEPHDWRDYLTETQKARYDKIEKEVTELEGNIASEEDFLAKLQTLVDSAKGKERVAFQKQYDTRESKLNRAKEQRDAKRKQLDTIKEGGVNKANARRQRDNNKVQKNVVAKSENALARQIRYRITPLTSAEREELAELETQADEAYGRMTSGALDWAKTIHRIYERGLYKEHPNGIAGYVYSKWGISKAHFYRQVAAVKQLDSLAELLNRKVVYLDAQGNEEKSVLDATKLPQNLPSNEKQLRFLATVAKDDPTAQLRIWARAVEDANAKGQSEVPVSLLQRVADEMVASGALAVGLDAYLQKKERSGKGKSATASSPLEFNTYISRAQWRGHVFDIVSLRTADDTKVYEVHVDHTPLVGVDGNPVRYYAVDTARRAAEENAEKIEPDMWGEDTKPPVKAEPAPPAPATAANSAPAPKAKSGKGKARTSIAPESDENVAEKLQWWVGTDKLAGGKKRHTIFSTPKNETPTEESTGHDYITGEFDSEQAAQKYVDDGFADIDEE